MFFEIVLAAAVGAGTSPVVPAELLAAAQKLAQTKTYRVTMPAPNGTMTSDVERPGSVRTHVEMAQPYDVIRIDSNVWMHQPNQPWTRLSSAAAAPFGAMLNIGLPPDARVTGPTLGNDGTGPAHVYTVVGSGPDPALQWYIRVSDERLHRLVGPGKGGTSMIMDIDDYGEAVQ